MPNGCMAERKQRDMYKFYWLNGIRSWFHWTSEIYDKSVKSRDQDQTAPMFWLILLYTFPLRECMVVKGRLRVENNGH